MNLNLKKFFTFLFILLIFAASASATGVYEVEPTFSPYTAGKVKAEFLNSAIEEVNYIRWLVGVPNNVAMNTDYNNKAQHGAVLLDAIDTLTHTPSKPSDMSDEFYQLGYEATTHGNLFVSKMVTSKSAVGNVSISQSLKGYMEDSDSHNVSKVGHRRWLMNPRMKQTGFGISTRNGFSVTYVIEDFGKSGTLTEEEYKKYLEWLKWPISDEYITWPTAKHKHPLSYFDADTAWSVTLNSNVFDECDVNSVNVTLTCLTENETWTFNNSSSDGDFYVCDNSIAYDECIIFRPNDIISYEDGEVWRVDISGLKRKDGKAGNISYTVKFVQTATRYDEEYFDEEDEDYDEEDEAYQYAYNKGGGDSEVSCNLSIGFSALILIFGIPHVKKFLRV